MKICSIKTNNPNKNLSFKAGVTNLYSDFDGTYMPKEYKHDSMVKDTPPINRKEFGDYFDDFKNLLNRIKGKEPEPKLNFSVTTGRNLHEFNYVMQKLRDKGLEVPLPDSLITCNGGDEYFRRKDCDNYFKSSFNRAFLPQDVNNEKRDWVKKLTGWDGDEIRENLRKQIDGAIVLPNNKKRDALLSQISPAKGVHGRITWISDIFKTQRSEEELRNYLEENAKGILDSLQGKEKDDLKWTIGEVAHELTETKNGKHKMVFLEAPTNQCNWTYPGDISLQSKLEKMNPVPKFYASVRQDGNLNFNIAYPWVYEHRKELMDEVETNKPTFQKEYTPGSVGSNVLSEFKLEEKSGEAFNIHGEKTATKSIRPRFKTTGVYLENGGLLDKFHDVQKRAKEILDKNLNDLIIVAGDGKNDIRALDLREYLGNNSSFCWDNLDEIEKLKKLPIISIFVNNKELKDYSPYFKEELYNSDGIVRCIIVDPKKADRPHTLQEAIEIAVNEYAKRNPEFKKNLSAEMLENITKNPKNYPVQAIVTEEEIQQRIKNKLAQTQQPEPTKTDIGAKINKEPEVIKEIKPDDVEKVIKEPEIIKEIKPEKTAPIKAVEEAPTEVIEETIKTKKDKIKKGLKSKKKIMIPLLIVLGLGAAIMYFIKKAKRNPNAKGIINSDFDILTSIKKFFNRGKNASRTTK